MMKKNMGKRLFVPMALTSAVAAVALTAAPASAASVSINVAANRMPQGAACVYVTDITTGATANAGGVRFTQGRSVTVRMGINSGDNLSFEWHGIGTADRLPQGSVPSADRVEHQLTLAVS
jgi:hypothetical protein